MPHACRKTAHSVAVAILAPLTLILMAASLPAHPPVPTKKPTPPAEEKPAIATSPKTDEVVPVPEKRPTPPAEAPGDNAPAPEAPLPKTKPHDEKAPPAGATAAPEPAPKEKPRQPLPTPGLAEDGAALAACYHALDRLGVAYTKESTVNDAGRCGMEAPVSVTRILPDVTLKPANKMRCKTALALARWTKRVVEPAAEELGDDVHLTGLTQGSAYVCRLRNNADHGKISEHAFGDAIDIVGFSFAGHDPIAIEPRERTGEIAEGFQRAVVGGACLYFTTVLGPHADAAHQDNLHLDVMARESGFRLCE